MNYNYYIWIEIEANKNTITDPLKFRQAMENCKDAGIGSVILSVKDTTGFVIYDSQIAPHYYEYDDTFEDKDYLLECLQTVHSLGMKFYASSDVFAEGNKSKPHPKMPAIRNTEWQSSVYGLNPANELVIQPITEKSPIRAVGNIDDFNEIFVNPANDEVCEYELSLLNEIMVKYVIDGITLDRVRYVGLSSDFSPITKKKWDNYLGRECNWPYDIYQIRDNHGTLEVDYGDCFGEFVTFRAGIIKDFIERVRNLVDSQPKRIEFWDYTGSWYPLYYQVGANWASKNYKAGEYPWVDTDEYKKTGYAELLGGLMSGFYYSYVTEQEARDANQPAYWYSVEGSGKIAAMVTKGAVPIVGSLFLKQYEENLPSMTEAVKMCFQKSTGCMLFDLSYLVENDWWKYVTINFGNDEIIEPLHQDSLPEIVELFKECFPEEFLVSEEHLANSTFYDQQLCPEATLCIRKEDTKELLGAIICKESEETNSELPNYAWITALFIKPKYQNRGYGRRLYRAAEKALKKIAISKIYVGQDYHNLFSGIPAPDDQKLAFFQNLGFIINSENHYDLASEITYNVQIDRFDTSPFEGRFTAEALKLSDKQRLYRFLDDEFPGRWKEQVEDYLENSGDPEEIIVLKDRKDQEIRGFCKIHVNVDGTGGLGPIGIAKSIRGNQVGDFILQQSLLHLRSRRGKNIGIDWTILKDYYGKFDFKPVRIYRGAYKEF
jgi:GNAT superfamily N-acetyltransferase